MQTNILDEACVVTQHPDREQVPPKCERTLMLMGRMTDMPLSMDELAELADHAADCPCCGLVAVQLHERRLMAMEREEGGEASATSMMKTQ